MAKTKNISENYLKNIKQLENEIFYNDYEYKKEFSLLCKLLPDMNNEKLNIEIIDKEKYLIEWLVYVMVIDWRIFKIGHTIWTIKDRIQSYNCWKLTYRLKWTASVTNFYVLQSLLHINKEVHVYAFFPEPPEYELWGEKYKDSFPIPKKAENILINKFIKKYNKKPIWCTQT